ncbi:hypothetical protein HMPREF1062_06058 [Bacteroides cellulosilyticus CL02T12C19]|uniref:Uncharacterized protein n=1 Tax=Bacteroides cellulosilyticus CL02T12C19 TaxID=997874 RepID=I8UWC2_9BACE|nr:hypothetical protein [Bacteroides cellulosilyticus]EIY17277.1 hypothetical protein HMPREF1062_06058 [Bacteroides cellulosilyticus CL02T12C19]
MRQNLTYPLVIYVEHGKPVYLLPCKMAGKLTAMKAELVCRYKITEKANAVL